MISKRVLFIAAAVLLASTAGAWAAGVNVNNFQVASLNIVGASDYLNLQSTASWGIVAGTATTPVPTPNATIHGYVNNGFAGTAWNGTGGIQSSPAAADAVAGNMFTSLADWSGDDAALFGALSFHGHAIASADTLIAYTYYGDCDGDGIVTDLDFGYINYAYQSGGGPEFGSWVWGDFDRDGAVTDLDYGYINYLYQSGGNPEGTLGGGWGFSAAAAAPALAPVPEPSTLVLLVVTGLFGLVAYLRKR
jgi:hypothetical protein